MMRLDHNRAIAQLANKTGARVSEISNMTVWGNHSPSQYPDLRHARVRGSSAWDAVGATGAGGEVGSGAGCGVRSGRR